MPESPRPKQEPGLTIGDLTRRTGLTAAVLRTWEARYGFPVPTRLASGHRRYTEEDAAAVDRVLRSRDAGVRLEAAIAEVRADRGAPPAPSVFAELRRRHPALPVHRLRKATLLALSWAIEDECCARAQRPVLFGAFQEARYYDRSAPRWRELARVARGTVALADFGGPVAQDPGGAGPHRVHLADDAPMRREWAVVCDAPDLPAVLTAWEVPGQEGVPDRERVFESIWTVDPRAVRDAARVCARVCVEAGDAAGAPLLHALADEAARGGYDLAAATTLFNRVVAYADAVA